MAMHFMVSWVLVYRPLFLQDDIELEFEIVADSDLQDSESENAHEQNETFKIINLFVLFLYGSPFFVYLMLL